MLILVKGQSREVQITSIILGQDAKDPTGMDMKMFFCFNCQNPVLQYNGFVVRVIPGNVPIPLPKLIRCSNSKCKHLYRFETVV